MHVKHLPIARGCVMTMRTNHSVKCVCGHIGAIVMSENDQPYSQQWAKYRLEGLNGQGDFYTEGFAQWNEVFEKLSPICPRCNKPLSVSNMVSP